MSTFYKLCSLCLKTGEMKSSWVAHNKQLELTYEFDKMTEPCIGKLFGATEEQVCDSRIDLSLATSFGVLLRGEGVQANASFPNCLADSEYTPDNLVEAWEYVLASDRDAWRRELGILLHWFTPRYIEAVCDVNQRFMDDWSAEKFLNEVGIDAASFYRPELGLGERRS